MNFNALISKLSILIQQTIVENFLYAIIYPLARELFAFSNSLRDDLSRNIFCQCDDGPPLIEKAVAKSFRITIMRLPRSGVMFAGCEALESGLIFLSVL